MEARIWASKSVSAFRSTSIAGIRKNLAATNQHTGCRYQPLQPVREGPEMTKDDILIGLVMAAKAERDAGFDGWSAPDCRLREQLDALVGDGLAEMKKDDFDPEHPTKPIGLWWRPTPKGESVCPATISRAN